MTHAADQGRATLLAQLSRLTPPADNETAGIMENFSFLRACRYMVCLEMLHPVSQVRS